MDAERLILIIGLIFNQNNCFLSFIHQQNIGNHRNKKINNLIGMRHDSIVVNNILLLLGTC
jgi:hypothetical protein